MNELIQRLVAQGPLVTDGAWGTQLQARGLSPGEFPDAWNLTFPERVAEVARAYVDSGSRIILTNTFGANRVRLAEFGFENKLRKINRAGVEISRSAATDRASVFASIGPTGKLLMGEGVSADKLRDAFEEQAEILAEAGADALVIETMTDVEEGVLAIAAARTTGLPVIACFVFDSGKNKDRTMMGNTPEEAARSAMDAGADVIGANCGQGIAGFATICRQLRAATKLPIWLKPNAGLPELIGGRPAYRMTPEEFAGQVRELLTSGANFIGGCCGTSPDFIRAVRIVVDRQTMKHAIGG